MTAATRLMALGAFYIFGLVALDRVVPWRWQFLSGVLLFYFLMILFLRCPHCGSYIGFRGWLGPNAPRCADPHNAAQSGSSLFALLARRVRQIRTEVKGWDTPE